jgi:hypothetical protein
MRKQDLRDGMIVENGEGIRFIVMGGGSYLTCVKTYYTLTNIREDLTHPLFSELNINKVFEGKQCDLGNMLSKPGRLLWEREKEPKEYTISQLENMLGYPIKIVKES